MRGLLFAAILCLVGCGKDLSVDNCAKVYVDQSSYSFEDMRFVSTNNLFSISNNINSGMDLDIVLDGEKIGDYTMGYWNRVSFSIGSDYYTSVSGVITTTLFESNVIKGSFEGVFAKNGKATQQYRASGTFKAFYAAPK